MSTKWKKLFFANRISEIAECLQGDIEVDGFDFMDPAIVVDDMLKSVHSTKEEVEKLKNFTLTIKDFVSYLAEFETEIGKEYQISNMSDLLEEIEAVAKGLQGEVRDLIYGCSYFIRLIPEIRRKIGLSED